MILSIWAHKWMDCVWLNSSLTTKLTFGQSIMCMYIYNANLVPTKGKYWFRPRLDSWKWILILQILYIFHIVSLIFWCIDFCLFACFELERFIVIMAAGNLNIDLNSNANRELLYMITQFLEHENLTETAHTWVFIFLSNFPVHLWNIEHRLFQVHI